VKPTIKEVLQYQKQHAEFSTLVEAASARLGKAIGHGDTATLLYLHDTVGLPMEVILMEIAYAVSIGKGNMRYVEKLAVSLYDTGIITPEALTERLRQLEAAETAEGLVKRLFGFSRSLTAKEKGFVADWTGAFAFGDAMIEKAYELAVTQGDLTYVWPLQMSLRKGILSQAINTTLEMMPLSPGGSSVETQMQVQADPQPAPISPPGSSSDTASLSFTWPKWVPVVGGQKASWLNLIRTPLSVNVLPAPPSFNTPVEGGVIVPEYERSAPFGAIIMFG
jgi:hypothetical protein